MKKNKVKIIYLIITVLFAGILYDCNKDDIVADLIINNKTLDIDFFNAIPTDGGSRELQFKSSSDWTITVNDTRTSSWLSISPSSGKAGSTTAIITASENNTHDERQAKITISAGSTTKYINATQKQKDALTVTSSRFEVAKDGGEIELEIKANIDFNITIAECCKDWISQVETKTLTTHKLIFKISPNKENTVRSGAIIISGGGFSEDIKVFQIDNNTLVLNKKEYNLSSSVNNITVELNSNFDFEVVMPNIDWIKEITTGAISSHTRYFEISENETYDARSTYIVFKSKDSTISDTVSIKQVQKGAIIISTKEYNMDKDGGEIDIEVVSSIEFDISFDTDWISQVIPQVSTRTLDTYNLKFKIDPNNGSTRSGKITLKDKNTSLFENITITQIGVIPPTLYESTDYSKDGVVLTLQTATIGNGIDLVIVGDAFSDKDMATNGKYEQRMGEAMNHFFSEEPYKTYRNRYNVYCIKAVSKNEVYKENSETVFSCKLAGGNSTGISGNDDKIFTYALKVPSISNTRNLSVIAILNSPIYAGTCYMWTNNASIAYCPIVEYDDDEYRQIITHEAGGHGFAKLYDEYSYSGTITNEAVYDHYIWQELGWGANADITNNPATISWSHILSDTRYTGLIGIYEGAMTFEEGAYRPTFESIMRYNTGGFNPPSREAIFNQIMELSGESYNYEKFVDYDVKNRTKSAIARSKAQTARVDTKTFVPLAPPVIRISSPNVTK